MPGSRSASCRQKDLILRSLHQAMVFTVYAHWSALIFQQLLQKKTRSWPDFSARGSQERNKVHCSSFELNPLPNLPTDASVCAGPGGKERWNFPPCLAPPKLREGEGEIRKGVYTN